MIDFMDQLSIDGWKAALFVVSDGADTCEEAPEGMVVGDPKVVRREQWIVAGDQYVLTAIVGTSWCPPELGEYEHNGHEESGMPVRCLEDLLPLVRRRLEAGAPRERMHPVLLALL